ncbi:Uncharacterized membrane protein [Thiothrix caldifontis]|uniref:Uncharacterized membrane protein n=1 Tax=Thiothrix caldifontis TaxID=525918 RepID=A0A1H3Y6U1_9GAMM|nr:DUF2069 domain-containing protein [Thiothrix caldifontis]SEA06562.1 Uncharacterized membrane protein [Thiothrix caldifontis]
MNKLPLWRNLTLFSLLGLIGLIVVWNGLLASVQHVPLWLEIPLLLAPLALLVRGIVQGNAQTHVFAVLMSLLYLLLGIWVVLDPQERLYGYALIFLSIGLYAGAFMSAKILGKRNKGEVA